MNLVALRLFNIPFRWETTVQCNNDDTLDALAGARYFTTLDLASGYWQVTMDPAAKEKTAFITHSGLYEFNAMPFGLCNAPATFQHLMEIVLAGLTRNKCFVYMYLDDIPIISNTWKEHLENISLIFEKLRKAELRLKRGADGTPSTSQRCHNLSDQWCICKTL